MVEDIEGGGPCNTTDCNIIINNLTKSKKEQKKVQDIELLLNTGLGGDSCVDNACRIPFLPFSPWVDWTTSSDPWSFPVYDSWGVAEIDPADFDLMLKAVGDDLQSTITLGWYDTPFFDKDGDLTGVGCINNSCYDRSELNYIGEGEALAKMGWSRDSTLVIVKLWKFFTNKELTQGTIDMTIIGWDYYTVNYSGNP